MTPTRPSGWTSVDRVVERASSERIFRVWDRRDLDRRIAEEDNIVRGLRKAARNRGRRAA